MAILAIVNAGKEGQIESKMMKSRHMEEIREARQKEAEAKQEQRKLKLVRKVFSVTLWSSRHHWINPIDRTRQKTLYDANGNEDQKLTSAVSRRSIKRVSKQVKLIASGCHSHESSSMISNLVHVKPGSSYSCAINSFRRIGSNRSALFTSSEPESAILSLIVLDVVDSTSFAMLIKNWLAY